MTTKKIFGILFIILAIILTLAILGQLPALFSSVYGIFAIFSGCLNSSEAGTITGHFVYWVIHISLTVVFWNYGVKWTKRTKKTIQTS